MQPILEQYRAKSKICPKQLGHLVYRSKDRFERAQTVLAEFKRLGAVPHPGLPELSRADIFSHTQKTVAHLRSNSNINVFDEDQSLEECFLAMNFHSPGSIGLVMTASIIRWMGSNQQVDDWLPKIQKCVIMACYAQTELGTGSDVQNLQTMAVFDPKTQEFVFHTPNTASIKWWPGDLGLACSHAAVFARLISNGKDHGVQAFFVELRDPVTHIPHKGVEVGDIGPKLGYNTKDNGFLKFNQFRTSKNALLARYITVDQEGNVKKGGNPKQMYSSMMRTRTVLLTMNASSLAKACTIATRYSLFRTQFKDSKGVAIPIFNYQMQKDKLLREISKLYTMALSINSALRQIQKNKEAAKKDDFSELQSTHIMLCCFKAMFTTWATDGVSNLIKACGGHGYSNFSGLPHIFLENFADQILEGENSVLLLQVSRYLLKCYGRVMKNNTKKVTGFFTFVKDVEKHLETAALTGEQLTNVENLNQPFLKATCVLMRSITAKMMTLMQETTDVKKIWDTMIGNDNQRLARIYSVQLIIESALESYRTLENGPIKTAMTSIIRLFAINQIEENAGTLLLTTALTQETLEALLNQKNQLLEDLSPDALVLAEGWQYDDVFLNSALALQKDNPYDNLYSWAKEHGTLNRFENQIHPGVKEHQLKVSRLREQRL